MAMVIMTPPDDGDTIERKSLCLSGPTPGIAIHAGETDFKNRLDEHFRTAENNTAERLIDFKNELKALKGEDFWNVLMEGLASICRAQFAFVSKRILVEDHDTAVEMPPIGEVGSCLMGVALYWNDGSTRNLVRDYKYYAWNAPCSYMRHDKVFLVPEGLSSFVTDNPNQLPFECDAYLGVPLFADGKCFAHFGVMWTKEGLEGKKELSWGYLEMIMHSLEDLITDRLVSGHGFAKVNEQSSEAHNSAGKVIPQQAITATQSLRPYARSLSHELRTPMQGVVGMLDVMHATVQEQIEGSSSKKIRDIFEALKNSIETVQDSSKRAVEAADNVVQAYDLDMQIPETPSNDAGAQIKKSHDYFTSKPRMGDGSSIVNPLKRRREDDDGFAPQQAHHPNKARHLNGFEDPNSTKGLPCHRFENTTYLSAHDALFDGKARSATIENSSSPQITPSEAEGAASPILRQSNIRDLIPVIIHDSLRVGGRPDSAITEPTESGEKIEVRSRSSNGHASQKHIEWSVATDVPEFLLVDEKDIIKIISAVFLNAIKFTEEGHVFLHAKMSQSGKFVLLNVTDTGTGIPETFQPELFKPFSREDHSITRSREGLGLGLLVAKGTARRIGGDITLIRSSTTGTDQGTDFEIRIPSEAGERYSRATTPFAGTPDITATKSTPKFALDETISLFPPKSGVQHSTFNGGHAVDLGPAAHSPVPSRKPSLVSKTFLPTQKAIDKDLARKYPLRILVAEDNKINRKLLVNMLGKFGYTNVYEAFDGKEAVRIMEELVQTHVQDTARNSKSSVGPIDVVLMDLWMPEMDGYEATEKILHMFEDGAYGNAPIVLAVSADVTDAAVTRATKSGMQGYMTKPYKLVDLQRLILESVLFQA